MSYQTFWRLTNLTPGRQGSGSTKKYLKITRSDRKSTSSSHVEQSWETTLDLKLAKKNWKNFPLSRFLSRFKIFEKNKNFE